MLEQDLQLLHDESLHDLELTFSCYSVLNQISFQSVRSTVAIPF